MVRVLRIDLVHIGITVLQSFERGYIERSREGRVQRHGKLPSKFTNNPLHFWRREEVDVGPDFRKGTTSVVRRKG